MLTSRPRTRSFNLAHTKLLNLGRLSTIGGTLALAIWLTFVCQLHAQTLTTLATFDDANGAFPYYLVQGRDGNLYGTTGSGGNQNCSGFAPYGCGIVFKITPAGVLTTLYSFCSQSNCGDGATPAPAGLVLATDGNFYGTTIVGGGGSCSLDGCGTVFKITPAGNLTTLYAFCHQQNCADGSFPTWLVQGADGGLYGTAAEGGGSYGDVFNITTAGRFTVLSSFSGHNGILPNSLMQATDGNFYGTTSEGGGNRKGDVFRVTPAGSLKKLYGFCEKTNCTDGAYPAGGLVQGSDGNFYGTSGGGANNEGTVFKITTGGKLTTLYSFCSQANCSDGAEPTAGLVQATDGNFYGTTFYGGANSYGTVFQMTPAGRLTTLYNFCSLSNCADGASPAARLVQRTDGILYGATRAGGGSLNCGSYGCGTVFSLNMGLGPFVAFVRASGKVGQTAEILGQGLTGTTGVSFNGAAASFSVKSATYLTATVPTGATTGLVTVTTPGGTLSSNVAFRVIP